MCALPKRCLICEGDGRNAKIAIGFETAALPTSSEEFRKTLLNFAIVGGGRKSSVSTTSFLRKFI